MTSVKILGTGHFVPATVATNDDFAEFLDTSDEWIVTRTGMKERHIAVEEPTWYMGAMASKRAVEMAGIDIQEIDLILCTTVWGDFYNPSTACMIQRELGIEDAIAFDMNTACTGIACAIDTARRYIATGDVRKALIVCAETLSQMTDYTDRSTCVLFGDGAGACIVEGAEGLYGSCQGSDASGVHHLYAKRERQDTPFGKAVQVSPWDPFPYERLGSIVMNGPEVYKFATKTMAMAVRKSCEKAGITVEDIDMLLPHQANIRIVQTAIKNLKMPAEKVAVNIQKYGNSSSATLAICLDEWIRDGKIQRGDTICLVGFGSGLTYGSVVMTY